MLASLTERDVRTSRLHLSKRKIKGEDQSYVTENPISLFFGRSKWVA